jgi:triacylglycerol esterase/lipase EstA (alpha/beta hydrolase family)
VVIPGIMGSTLSASGGGGLDHVWLNPLYLALRRLDVLRLREDGRTGSQPGYEVTASGLIPFVYWRQILSLRRNWNVYPFPFDWRKDLADSADELSAHIDMVIGEDAPVHIVGHSMGGLVARTFIQKYAPRWKSMWDQESDGRAGGRLVMLGTPNHGSFAVPLLLTGLGAW